MTTYNTGSPVPSVDVRDLYDNAENLDNFSNGQLDAYADRLGVSRKSLAGMRTDFDSGQSARSVDFDAEQVSRGVAFQQFLLNSGYDDLGDYDSGPLEITARNQVFIKDGEYWRAAAALALPYTTIANWATDQVNFVSAGDAVLRQDLAIGDGSALVKYLSPLTGAVARTAADKLGESVSVIDFKLPADIDYTDAFARAFTASSSVLVPPGTYAKTGTVTIPANGRLVLDRATITQGDNLTAFQSLASGWSISGAGTITRLAGAPSGLIAGSVGLYSGPAALLYNIHGNITFSNFSEAGVVLDGGDVVTGAVGRGQISGVRCTTNTNGFVLLAGFAAEYCTFSGCVAQGNLVDGVYVETGNIDWHGGNINTNDVGVHLEHPASGVNPHHGMFIGTHINHNFLYQMHAENVSLGMEFVGCHFYDNANPATGRIKLENSRGVTISSGIVGCGIEATYDGSHPHYGYNKVSNNLFTNNGAILTGVGLTRKKLLVSGNYSFAGPSLYNDPRESFALKRIDIDFAYTDTVNLASVGTEIIDNRDALGGAFVVPASGWYTTTINLNLSFASTPTTEYITFARDDAATGTFTELHRLRISDCASGVTASVNASHDFIVSGGGQITAFLFTVPGNAVTVKNGSQISFKSLS